MSYKTQQVSLTHYVSTEKYGSSYPPTSTPQNGLKRIGQGLSNQYYTYRMFYDFDLSSYALVAGHDATFYFYRSDINNPTQSPILQLRKSTASSPPVYADYPNISDVLDTMPFSSMATSGWYSLTVPASYVSSLVKLALTTDREVNQVTPTDSEYIVADPSAGTPYLEVAVAAEPQAPTEVGIIPLSDGQHTQASGIYHSAGTNGNTLCMQIQIQVSDTNDFSHILYDTGQLALSTPLNDGGSISQILEWFPSSAGTYYIRIATWDDDNKTMSAVWGSASFSVNYPSISSLERTQNKEHFTFTTQIQDTYTKPPVVSLVVDNQSWLMELKSREYKELTEIKKWNYRRPITIDNSGGSALTDYQIKIELDSSNFDFSKANSDGSDLRFTDEDGTTWLSYWIENYDSTGQTATIWVKVPSIAASSTKTIYLYYGNASATSKSSITDTALNGIGDDFDGVSGSAPDSNLWDAYKEGSANAIVELDGNGNLHLAGEDSVISSGNVVSKNTITNDFVIRVKRQFTDFYYVDCTVGNGVLQDMDNGGQSSWWHTAQGDGYDFSRNNDASTFIAKTPSGAALTKLVETTNTIGAVNTDEIEEFIYDSNGNLIWKHNDSQILSSTDTNYLSSNKYVGLHQGEYSNGNGGDSYIDFIFVRKYASIEPTISVPSEPPKTSDWTYKRPITIDNTNGDALTDYQIKIELDSSNFDFSKANLDGSDIRFTDDDETTLLPYWIENYDSTNQTAIIWVKVPNISANSTKTIYLYYGNASATDASSGDNTFILFDDFDGSSLDSNKWTAPMGSVSLSDSELHFPSQRLLVKSIQTFPRGIRIREYSNVNSTAQYQKMMTWWGDSYNTTYAIPSGNAYSAYHYSDYSHKVMIYKLSSGSGTNLNENTDVYLGTTWHTFSLLIGDNNHLELSVDNETKATATDTTFTTENFNIFRNGYTDIADDPCDWLFVSKYTDSEPTNSVGNEEVVNAPSYNAIMFGVNF